MFLVTDCHSLFLNSSCGLFRTGSGWFTSIPLWATIAAADQVPWATLSWPPPNVDHSLGPPSCGPTIFGFPCEGPYLTILLIGSLVLTRLDRLRSGGYWKIEAMTPTQATSAPTPILPTAAIPIHHLGLRLGQPFSSSCVLEQLVVSFDSSFYLYLFCTSTCVFLNSKGSSILGKAVLQELY